MKALKLVLIATVVSFAMMSYAGVDKENPAQKVEKERVIKISLTQALTNPGLVCAMYQQLTPAFLQVEQPGLYVATVRYMRKLIEISGTREAWVEFFRIKPGGIPKGPVQR